LMLPYLIAGGFLAVLHLLGNHIFIPYGNKIHYDFQHTYIWKHNDKGKTSDVHMFIEPQTVAYIKYYRKQDSTARDIQIERFEGNDLVFMLKARTAKWLGPPNNWRLKNYEIRTFDGLNETLYVDKKKELDTTLNITPADFVEYVNQKEMMATSELLEFINNQKKRGAGKTNFRAIFNYYFDYYWNGSGSQKSAGWYGIALSYGRCAWCNLYFSIKVFKHFCYKRKFTCYFRCLDTKYHFWIHCFLPCKKCSKIACLFLCSTITILYSRQIHASNCLSIDLFFIFF